MHQPDLFVLGFCETAGYLECAKSVLRPVHWNQNLTRHDDTSRFDSARKEISRLRRAG